MPIPQLYFDHTAIRLAVPSVQWSSRHSKIQQFRIRVVCKDSESFDSAADVSRRFVLQGAAAAWSALADPANAAVAPVPAGSAKGLHDVESKSLLPTITQQAALPRGVQALRDPDINRGLATSQAARELFQIDGLLPAGQVDKDVEAARAKAAVDRACTPLEKYQVLMCLAEQDAQCFYRLIQQDVSHYLPIIYTPTVGAACLAWGTLLPRPMGLYLSIQHHAGKVQQVIDSWPYHQVKVAVITDGERILGLGDLGAHGMGIPIGKRAVYGACGVDPTWILPVTVDVGCNVSNVQDDPFYLGLRQRRVGGSAYYDFIDEVVEGIQRRYGSNTIMHWEDVGVQHSFQLLQQLTDAGTPTFNDDIQCTAAVTLAALLAATRLDGVPPLTSQTFLFYGAGQANLGCAQLLSAALQEEGLTRDEAKHRIWMMDSKGLILSGRENLTPEKVAIAQDATALPTGLDICSLPAVIAAIKPSALVGAAAVGGAFNETVLQSLTSGLRNQHGFTARPVVMALSNPTDKAECTFQEAYDATQGAVVFASGTEFPPIQLPNGSWRVPAQANNCYIFPGLGLGCMASGAVAVTEQLLLAAAQAVAGMVTAQDLSKDCILSSITHLQETTLRVASAVVAAASLDMVASTIDTTSALCAMELQLKDATADKHCVLESQQAGATSRGKGILDCVQRMQFLA